MKRRRSAAKTTFVVLLTAFIAFGLAMFPIRGHRHAQGAPPAGSDKGAARGPDKPAAGPQKAPKPGPSASSSASPSAPAPADQAKDDAEDLKTLPVEGGLPVGVQVAVFYLEVTSLDDAKGEFVATTDLRMRWKDLRQRFDESEEPHGYKEYRFSKADKKLATMWTPRVDVTNRVDAPSFNVQRLRISPDGEIELTTRTTAKYKIAINASRFPFDRQHLMLDLIVRENGTDEVELETHHDDVEWSRPAQGMTIDGWKPGIVDLDHSEVLGWNGDRYGRLQAALDVDRDPMGALAPVFIPLVASLLIPLLAVWMNKTNEEGFEIEAFELANVVIGGLFSVIALSFAIYSAYGVIAGGDNTVTRLFALNYVSLACALGIVVLFFRFNMPRKLFGPYVHEELFRFVLWALPLLSSFTSVAFILAARA
ncbi:MAG: hypothetical protein HY898_33220 [Deltaproteobacteria bacterium]|nr:hypothetical protein [Deltaproteobacteria bacterium]